MINYVDIDKLVIDPTVLKDLDSKPCILGGFKETQGTDYRVIFVTHAMEADGKRTCELEREVENTRRYPVETRFDGIPKEVLGTYMNCNITGGLSVKNPLVLTRSNGRLEAFIYEGNPRGYRPQLRPIPREKVEISPV